MESASSQATIERKLALSRDLANALDRTLKSRRLYSPEHPQAAQATNELVARFIEFFRHYAYLRVSVTPTDLKFEKHTILHGPQPDMSVPFKLYKDGIREFRINRGISREELMEFLGILDLDPQEITDMGEDVIALLWSCGFQFIDYIVVDEFDPFAGHNDEGKGEIGAAGDPGREKLIREIQEQVVGYLKLRDLVPVTFEVPGQKGKNLPARTSVDPEAVPEVLSYLQKESEDASKRIREFVDAEHLGSNMARTIDVLLDLLQTGTELDIKHVIPFLQTAVGYYLGRHDYSAIGHLLLRVNFQALLPRVPELSDVVKRLEAEIKSPMLAQNMVAYLNRGFRGDLEGLRSLFNVLGPSSAKVLAQVFPQVLSARTRVLLKEFILKYSKSDPDSLRPMLNVPDNLIFEVFDILGDAKPAWAAKETEPFLKHVSVPIRLRTISLLGRLEGLARTQMLLRLLKDSDPQIRLHVLRTLEEAKDQAMLMFIREWIEDKEFGNRPTDERFATLSAYAAIGGDNVLGYLSSLAGKKLPMLGKDKVRELREASMMAIARLNTPAALETLRQLQDKGDDHVRTFVESLAKPAPKKPNA